MYSSGADAKEENPKGIEDKRMKSRIRSKKARIRKKIYIQELEDKVKYLEKENYRLQNLLVMYRREELNKTSDETKNIMENIKEYRGKLKV